MGTTTRRARPAGLAALVLASLAAVTLHPTAAVGKPPGHNPPGNNGTVKINNSPIDSNPRNEPHVTCQFAVRFFNFDEGQTADITFLGHPPSGHGQVLLQQNNRVISDDPASGAGNDPDAVFYYSADDLDLTGMTAHPKQGYHIKLDVSIHDVPGGHKYKVFWLQPCAPVETPGPTETATVSPTETVSATETATVAPTETSGVLPTETSAVGPTQAVQQTLVPGARVLGEKVSRPSGLPFTGASGVLQLLMAGLLALLLGTLLHAASRRRPQAATGGGRHLHRR